MEISAEEELLVIRAFEGDKAAAKILIEQHQAWVYAMAFRICQEASTARKAAVQSFLSAFAAVKPLSQRKPFRILVARKLVSLLQNSPAASGSQAQDPKLNLMAEPPPEREALLGMFIRGLQQLSFNERVLLLLRDQGNLSFKAIAEVMRMSGSSIPRKISEARMKLRQFLSQDLAGKRRSDGM